MAYGDPCRLQSSPTRRSSDLETRDHGLDGRSLERRPPREHLVQHTPEAVQVAAAVERRDAARLLGAHVGDRKSTRLNSSYRCISYAVVCLKKKKARRQALDIN